jgi:hypothetical protein
VCLLVEIGGGAIGFHLGKAAAAVFIVFASRRFSGRCKVFWAAGAAAGDEEAAAERGIENHKEEEEDAVASSMITPRTFRFCRLPTAPEFFEHFLNDNHTEPGN